jgi:hypothetical protein
VAVDSSNGARITQGAHQRLPIVFSLKTHPILAIFFSPPASKLPTLYDYAQKPIETNQREALTVIFKKKLFLTMLCALFKNYSIFIVSRPISIIFFSFFRQHLP